MNRRVRIRCAMVPFMQWCRENGVPVCLLKMRLNVGTRDEAVKTRSSKGVVRTFGHALTTVRPYKFLIRDRDLDLVIIYVGQVEVLR